MPSGSRFVARTCAASRESVRVNPHYLLNMQADKTLNIGRTVCLILLGEYVFPAP